MKKIKLLCVILLFILSGKIFNNANAQMLPIQWQHCYGGTDQDAATSVIATPDGGVMILGYSFSNDGDHTTAVNGGGDFWVVKTNNYGDLMWQQSYGGSASEYGTALIKTNFGYALGGYTFSSDGQVTNLHGRPYPYSASDYWVVGIDSIGGLLWEKTYGGTSIEQLKSMALCRDGGFILAGFTGSDDGDITNYHGRGDAWIVKTNDTGAIIWQKAIGGRNVDIAASVQQTNDSGYVIGGYSNSDSTDTGAILTDYWISKLNDTGGIEWQKYYGGSGDDKVLSILQTSDNGYIMAGYTNSNDGDILHNHGGYDYWVLKTNKTGNKLWSKVYGGSGDDKATSIIQTSDGGYVIAGSSSSNDGDITAPIGGSDAWIVKLDYTGAIQWQKSVGEVYSDNANSIVQTADSGYVIAGYKETDHSDVSGYHSFNDYWVFKLDKYGVSVPEPSKNMDAVVFPNPASLQLYFEFPELFDGIKIEVFDVAGRMLDANVINTGTKVAVDIHNYDSGVYFYKITTKNKIQNGKFIVAR